MITASLNDSYNELLRQEQPMIVQPDSLLMNNSSYLTTTTIDTVPELLAENSHNGSSSNNSTGGGVAEHQVQETVLVPETNSYATQRLPPTTKLEEEPNPFEQSFTQLKLPSIDSSSVNTSNNTNKWNSLRSGILSPSMLPGPTQTSTVVRRPIKYELETTTFYNHTYENPPPTVNRAHVKHTRKMSSNSNYSTIAGGEEEGSAYNTKNNKRQKRATNTSNSVKDPEDEDKRKNFLERNRIAALKCRQRKKQWLQNLQTKVEYLAAHNEQFHMQANVLREELIQLKTLLMTHKDCPINQENMKLALSRPIPGVPSPASLSHPLLFTKSGGNQQGEFEEEEEEYEDDDS